MSMRRLFIGGPWDGQVRDVEHEAGRSFKPYEALRAPGSSPGEIIVYHPRDVRWQSDTGRVRITVMAHSLITELGRPVLAALLALAGVDVVWEPDPNDGG